MPELRCTVQTCTHNKQFYCALDKIVVEGNTAEKSQDTCCGSFEERKGNSYSNVTGEASASTNIHCEAKDCMYNQKCECHAGKISVEGSNACRCESTECATFDCKG